MEIHTDIIASNGDGEKISVRFADYSNEVGIIALPKAIYVHAKNLPKLIKTLQEIQKEVDAHKQRRDAQRGKK